MGAIDEQHGAVLVACGTQRSDVGRVRMHREEAFRDDEDAVDRIFRPDFAEAPLEPGNVEVPVVVDVLCCRPRAFLQARVCKHVHDDMIVGPHEALHGRKSGGPAGRVENDFATVKKLGNDPLELERVLGVAKQSGRARTMHAVFFDCIDGRALDLGMRCQAEVVLGCKVNARVGPSGIGKGGAAGLGRGGRRLGIGPQIVLPAQVLPLKEGVEAGQEIRSRHHLVVPQAALQSLVWRNASAVSACPVRTHNNVPDCRNSRAILRGG